MIPVRRFLDNRVHLYGGDCRDILQRFSTNVFDAVVTDPPYYLTSIVQRFGNDDINGDGVVATAVRNRSNPYARAAHGFMGQAWDGGDVAFDPATWQAIGRVMKPGAHLVAFGGTRTYHRLACAIEDAGFEIRDAIMWHYAQGFPKSHDISKAIDEATGVKRVDNNKLITNAAKNWNGYGTALKPATEIICLARKPLSESTVAANVLKWGTGALNIDGCRIETTDTWEGRELPNAKDGVCWGGVLNTSSSSSSHALGRWPANICHDGSDEVVSLFPESGAGGFPATRGVGGIGNNGHRGQSGLDARQTDAGSAARFFYCAKADANDREWSKHPTVKPVDLMRWLIKLITPPDGKVLDPFAGTGTTAQAASLENCQACVLIEQSAEYRKDIARRLSGKFFI